MAATRWTQQLYNRISSCVQCVISACEPLPSSDPPLRFQALFASGAQLNLFSPPSLRSVPCYIMITRPNCHTRITAHPWLPEASSPPPPRQMGAPELPQGLSQVETNFLALCLRVDRARRPSAPSLLQHDFLRGTGTGAHGSGPTRSGDIASRPGIGSAPADAAGAEPVHREVASKPASFAPSLELKWLLPTSCSLSTSTGVMAAAAASAAVVVASAASGARGRSAMMPAAVMVAAAIWASASFLSSAARWGRRFAVQFSRKLEGRFDTA